MKTIGTITICDFDGQGSREVEITDIVRSVFRDHRFCTVARGEDNTFVLAVENPRSSGRNPLAQIYLTEESMLALVNCICLYYLRKGVDIASKMQELVDSDTIEFEYNNKEDGQ